MGFRVTVEVPLALTFFAFFLTDNINTNLMIYRTCYVILGYDKYNCSLLGFANNNVTKALEKLVQPKADVISMTKTIVDSVSAAILCLLVGAWSDRFGRKPVLVVNIIGYTLMNAVMVLYSAIDGASPWYMMTCSVPVILTGGGASLLAVFSAYLTDITTEAERGFRLGVFEVVMALAILAGSSSSSYIFNATSYPTVYSIASASCFLALLYVWWLLPESLEVLETTGRIKGLFQLRNVSGMFRTSFRQRPNHKRPIILLIMLALALTFVVFVGDGSVMFLFVREKFHWTLQQYTLYNSASNGMWIASTLFIVYVIHYRWRVKESCLVFAGFVSLMVGQFVQGLARVDWLLYVVAVIRIPSAAINPMTRSLLSKSVDADEVGKIFAVYSVIQSVLGFVGSPVYTTLYNATLDTNPGMFNFLTSGIHLVNALCLLIVLVLERRIANNNYSVLQTENGQENEETIGNDGSNDGQDLVVNG